MNETSLYLRPAAAILLSYALFSYVVLALASLGFATTNGMLVGLVMAVALGTFVTSRLFAKPRPGPIEPPALAPWSMRIAAFFMAIPFALTWRLPPFMEDDLMYHLWVPRRIARTASLLTDHFSIGAHMPQLFEYPLTLNEALGNPVSPFVVNTLMIGLIAYVALGLLCGRLRLPPWLAIIVTAAVMTTPVIFELSHSAYVELFFTALLLVTFALYADHCDDGADRTESAEGRRWTLLSVFVGLLAACKYFGLLVFILLFLAERYVARRPLKTVLKGVAIASVVALPWYLKSFLLTGNPTFPYLNFFFQSPLLSVDRGTLMSMMSSVYGQGRSLADILLLPVRLLGFTGFDDPHAVGFFGRLSLLFVLVLLAPSKKELWARLACLLAAVFAVLWTSSAQITRYLLPFLVVPLLIGVAVGARHGRRARALICLVAVLAVLQNALQILATSHREGTFDRLVRFETEQAFLEKKLPGSYAMAQAVNMRVDASKDRVMLIGNFGRAYYYDASTLASSFFDTEPLLPAFRPGALRPDLFWDLVRRENLTHIQVDWTFLERFHARDGRFDVEAFKAFLRDHGRVLVDQAPYSLIALMLPAAH